MRWFRLLRREPTPTPPSGRGFKTKTQRWRDGFGRPLDVDAFEGDVSIADAGEVAFDGVEAGDAVDKGGGADEVGPLDEFEAGFFQLKAGGVERAALMRDQDDAFELVNLHEELELIHDALLFQVGLRVAGEAGGTAGERDAVVAGEFEAVLEEVVEQFAHSAVGAVDGRGVNAALFVSDTAGVPDGWCRHESKIPGFGAAGKRDRWGGRELSFGRGGSVAFRGA